MEVGVSHFSHSIQNFPKFLKNKFGNVKIYCYLCNNQSVGEGLLKPSLKYRNIK